MKKKILLLLSALATIAGMSSSRAEDFYKDKAINLIVANDVGGGYDAYARLLARHMGRHIPGRPSFIIRNMPGAGGLQMANYLYSVAKPDGLTIGMANRSMPFQSLFGQAGASFKSETFTWLGTASSYANDAYCLFVRTETPFRTAADLQHPPGNPANIGALAAGGTDTDLILIAKAALNLNIHLIRGYKGAQDVALAMERGEVDGRANGFSSIRVAYPEQLKQGKLRFLIQFGRAKRWSELPDVPTAQELAQTPDDKALIELAELPLLLARPYLAPPGLPAEQATILRTAFMATQADPEYLAEAQKLEFDISPLDGDAIQTILQRIAKTPASLLKRYSDALQVR
jgi:tripartite-type tricarboxylate transporter receptor subunit TctC